MRLALLLLVVLCTTLAFSSADDKTTEHVDDDNGQGHEEKKDDDNDDKHSGNGNHHEETKDGGHGTHHEEKEDLDNDHHDEHHRIHLASWRWVDYNSLFIICVMIVSAAVVKVVYHEVHFLANNFVESCVLIVLGVLVGCVVHFGGLNEDFPKFTSELFFNYLLPPLILDAAYSLYDRDFVLNLTGIVQLAVFGTLFNVFATGLGLYGLTQAGAMGGQFCNVTDSIEIEKFTMMESLTFR